MQKNSYRLIKGFSLIELLVVISIIGILIGLSAFGLQGARASARNARRVSDIEQIRSGLELYRADCGDYPTNAEFPNTPGFDLMGDGSPLACSVSNTYIHNRPSDPSPGLNYRYNQTSATTYEICAAMENGGSGVACEGMNPAQCGPGTNCNYILTNP